MIEKVMNVFKVEELRQKIVLTVLLLFVYRIGFQIPIPGIALEDVQKALAIAESRQGGVLGMLNVLSAGDFMSYAIFSLGIMPYISSSIIFSILGKVIPALEKMVKEGSQGQKKLNQWMRWGTVPICLIQSIFVIQGIVFGKAGG